MNTDRPWWSWAAIAGSSAAVVSLFLPWRVVLAFGRIQMSGIEIDDGKLAAVFLAVVAYLLFPLMQGERIPGSRAVGGGIAALIFLAIAGVHATNRVVDQTNEFADLHQAGAGAWLAFVAGGVLVAAAVGGRRGRVAKAEAF